jgi:hypothetical protein
MVAICYGGEQYGSDGIVGFDLGPFGLIWASICMPHLVHDAHCGAPVLDLQHEEAWGNALGMVVASSSIRGGRLAGCGSLDPISSTSSELGRHGCR